MNEYDSKKALDVITYLMSLHNGKISKFSLMNMLYFIERQSISDNLEPIINDNFIMLTRGPALSFTMNILNDLEYIENKNVWSIYLQLENNEFTLISEVPDNSLTESEKKLIKKVYDQYKIYNENEFIELFKHLKECQISTYSLISIEDIFKAVNRQIPELLNSYYLNKETTYTSQGLD